LIDVFLKIFPLVILVVIGYLLNKTGKLKEETSRSMINIAFEVFLPATVFLAISKAKLNSEFLYIPVFAMIIIFSIYFASKIIFSKMDINENDKKVMVVGAMLMNTAAIGIPVMESLYGTEGAAVASLFDFGCAVLIYTLGYFTISKNNLCATKMIKKVLSSNVLWAMVLGLSINFFNIEIGVILDGLIGLIAGATIPVMMIAIGGIIKPAIKNGKFTLLSVFMRSFGGLVIGLLIVYLFGLEGIIKNMVLIGSILPSAIITIVFTIKEGLNSQLAIEIVSISTILFFILLPFVAQI